MSANPPHPPDRCLSTLRPTKGQPWSRSAVQNLWNGRKVSPVLDFDLPEFHRFRREHADRISLSGVQDKISVKLVRGRLVPTEADGEYILKPVPSTPGLDFQGDIPANEHLTMQIAGQMAGIPVPPNGLVFFPDGSPAYVVKRFDRDGETGRKRPQEDFCQLSGRSRETHGRNFKYEGSYEELGRVLERYCPSYAIEVEKLFRLVVFNYAVGNGDAHFKNFSLVPTPLGDHVLSPAYDLVNTRLHLPQESALALDLFEDDFETESFRRNGFFRREDFRELAGSFRLKPDRAERILDGTHLLAEQTEPLIEASLLSAEARDRYRGILADRARALRGD
ncbi:MAG TPA: HipA domain-containing protein [Bacteroidia bacterium]|nr:HipA domain-containing protein [Bacteroidia bacterium]